MHTAAIFHLLNAHVFRRQRNCTRCVTFGQREGEKKRKKGCSCTAALYFKKRAVVVEGRREDERVSGRPRQLRPLEDKKKSFFYQIKVLFLLKKDRGFMRCVLRLTRRPEEEEEMIFVELDVLFKADLIKKRK